ncbi:MAG: glycine betaine ABC transporter substrate-binding protein [Spirochaetales bacterium]
MEYGFDTTVTLLDVGEAFAAVANGEQDAMMEAWLPHLHEDYWDLYDGQLDAVGSLFTGARLGLAVPYYSRDDGIVAMSDLNSTAVANEFGNELCASTDSGKETIENEVIPNYLASSSGSWSVENLYVSDMSERLTNDFATGTDIAFFFFQPSRLFGLFDLHMLAQDGPIIWEADEIHTAIASDLADRKPGLASILRSVSFTNDQVNEMIVAFSDFDRTYRELASEWKVNNREVWEDW